MPLGALGVCLLIGVLGDVLGTLVLMRDVFCVKFYLFLYGNVGILNTCLRDARERETAGFVRGLIFY